MAGRSRFRVRPAAGWLAALALGCAMSSSDEEREAGADPGIEQALQRFETREYFLPTMFASGPEAVRAALLATPEMELLLAHPAEATPRVLARLREASGRGRPEAPIPLFVYLAARGDPAARADVVRWLEAQPDATEDEILSPWGPVSHAVSALRRLAPEAKLPADDREVFARRRELASLPGLGP